MGGHAEVRFHFDYLSPYAYLAWKRLGPLCEELGADLVAQPVLFGALLNHFGHKGPAEIPPKARFVLVDTARRAKLAGVPLCCPRYHPFNPLTALRISQRSVAGEAQHRVIDALWDHGWGRGGDLGDASELALALERAGLDRAMVERAREPAVKDELKQATESAKAQGVFGVPTMLVGDELFWGLDQLEFVAMALRGEQLVSDAELLAILPKGQSAQRVRRG